MYAVSVPVHRGDQYSRVTGQLCLPGMGRWYWLVTVYYRRTHDSRHCCRRRTQDPSSRPLPIATGTTVTTAVIIVIVILMWFTAIVHKLYTEPI